MPFLFDPKYLIIMIPCMILSGICAGWVRSAFHQWSQVGARNGMTGAQIARAILEWNSISDVRVEETPGKLSDHYDPRNKTLRLSSENYQGRSIAALGIAAHEVGHAIQHAQAYAWLNFRSNMVTLVGISSNFSWIVLMGGLLLRSPSFFLVGVILFAASTLFAVVTLPVEFDASRRALQALESGRILEPDEMVGARKVLRAAASTYVAAAISSIATLLYYVSLFMGQRRQ